MPGVLIEILVTDGLAPRHLQSSDWNTMMTSSNGNIFRVTGAFVIRLTKASDAEVWWFSWSTPKQTVEQTIRRHNDELPSLTLLCLNTWLNIKRRLILQCLQCYHFCIRYYIERYIWSGNVWESWDCTGGNGYLFVIEEQKYQV